MLQKKFEYCPINLGCDPEFFFSKGKKIIGSEKILPKNGILVNSGTKVITDGVQAELNPRANSCREILGREIRTCFQSIQETLTKNKGITADFSQTIEISQKELDSLDASSRQFGCAPSKNIHNSKAKIAIKDASKYHYRSAGGHIHLGTYSNYGEMQDKVNSVVKDPKRLVPMLDIIVGNTCVLIDRDPGNIERRKVYGRAGEFRTPSHGIEYRTLSNFWLQNYRLMSFVMGMSRLAVLLIANSSESNNLEKKILSRVRMKDIETAINTNDYNLAYRNFQKIKRILKTLNGDNYSYITDRIPLNSSNLEDFEYFIEKGKDHWIKQDPITHWANLGGSSPQVGWENFLEREVRPERIKIQKAKREAALLAKI